MPKLTIDNRPVEVEPGTTILEAARQAGIDIPTLCYLEGYEPSCSCFVCAVRVNGAAGFVPSCATVVRDGMVVESETDDVREARRTAVELLLSDHLGDCEAPCQGICPAGLAIPVMLRAIRDGDDAAAAAAARRDLVLPATLGRICPAPCEKGCRRKEQDDPVAIRSMHRWAGDAAIRAGRPFDLGEPKPPTGKRVAIIGAGPAGVATAVYLALAGHAATVFDEHDQAGGALRYAVPAEDLPPEVLDAELAVLAELGVELRLRTRVGRDVAFEELRREYDAVVVATGALEEGTDLFGLERTDAGVKADRRTLATPAEGVFAAGDVVRAQRMAVRSVGDAKTVVASLGRFLAGQPLAAPGRRFGVRIGKLQEGEIGEFMKAATEAGRVAPAGGPGAGFTEEEARTEAARCLHCDCRKPETCRLRAVAEACGASATRIKGERPVFRQLGDHPRVLYEPGKCIACGLCVQISERSREPLGLAFIGRGFDVVVGVPLDRSLAEALHEVAEECVRACPTAALAFR